MDHPLPAGTTPAIARESRVLTVRRAPGPRAALLLTALLALLTLGLGGVATSAHAAVTAPVDTLTVPAPVIPVAPVAPVAPAGTDAPVDGATPAGGIDLTKVTGEGGPPPARSASR